MFQFRPFPSYTYLIQCRIHGYCPCGLPHSDICGSRDICSSPQLFAACHVLLRLLMPRHSPCALFSLTFVGAKSAFLRFHPSAVPLGESCGRSLAPPLHVPNTALVWNVSLDGGCVERNFASLAFAPRLCRWAKACCAPFFLLFKPQTLHWFAP